MKRKKRRKLRKPFFKKKSFWFLFLVLISSSFLFYFSLFSSHFQVKETSISGIQTIQEDKLLKNFKSNATISLNILGNNLTSESLFIPSQGKISTPVSYTHLDVYKRQVALNRIYIKSRNRNTFSKSTGS